MIGSEALAREIKEFPFCAVMTEWETFDDVAWSLAGYPDDERSFLRTCYSIWVDYDILPEGWKFLAKGCSRTAFLGPDGVCYKLMNDAVTGTDMDVYRQNLDVSQNLAEAIAYVEHAHEVLLSSRGSARLAECHYFYDLDVLAMEYSKKISDCTNYAAFRNAGFFDIHSSNAWDDEYGSVMVDYAV